jgi:hypothetical protein
LHLVLPATFSSTDSHLHESCIGGLRYDDVDPMEDGFGGPRDVEFTEVRLQDFRGWICPSAISTFSVTTGLM